VNNRPSTLSRSQLAGLFFLLSAGALVVAPESLSAAGQQAESHVKLAATAGKIDKDGNQIITIKMQIGEDWHAYANPVKNEDLESCHTIVKIVGTKKLHEVSIDYPAGDRNVYNKEAYQVYQGNVEIKANIKRAAGDTGPLEVTVQYVTCNDKMGICLPPESVTLQVK
jgi:DsbC/DsbD-like thiol-disulfide interchange protein